MKHFEIKNIFAGAGGKKPKKPPPPKPPRLEPPELGEYRNLASYSYSEVVDLLCDGPIEGLTNENGYLLDEKSYLQGVYLNDVPVEVTNEDWLGNSIEINTNLEEEITGLSNILNVALKDVSKTNSWGYWCPNKGDNGGYDDWWKYYRNPRGRVALSEIREEYLLCSNSNKYSVPERKRSTMAVHKNLNKNTPSDQQFDLGLAWRNGWNFYADYASVVAANRATNPGDTDPGSIAVQYGGDTTYEINGESWPFWSKQIKQENGDNLIYFEFSTAVNRFEFKHETYWWTYDLAPIFWDGGFTDGIRNSNHGFSWGYRQKIRDGVDKIVEIATSETTNRFEKQFIAEKFKNVGIDIGERDENFNYSNINRYKLKRKISDFIYFYDRKNLNHYNFSFFYANDSGQTRKTAYFKPYIFYFVDEEYLLDGYVQEEHENAFINPKYTNITEYDQNTTYSSGSIFYYNGNYYEAIEDWSSATNSNRTPEQEANPDPETETREPKLLVKELEGSEINSSLFFDLYSKTRTRGTAGRIIFDFIIPVLDENKKWNGLVRGFNFEVLDDYVDVYNGVEFTSWTNTLNETGPIFNSSITNEEISFFNNVDGLKLKRKSLISSDVVKYNYSNVFMEFRNGEEDQQPLSFFKDVNIDHFYESELVGPFSLRRKDTFSAGSVQKVSDLSKDDNNLPNLNFAKNSVPNMDENYVLSIEETSRDIRGGDNFSDWDKIRDVDEAAQSITHIIHNPNTKSCFISLWIKQLSDMFEQTGGGFKAGQKKPGVLNIRCEVGLVNEEGLQTTYYDRFFQIVALIESPAILDIGSPENLGSDEFYQDVREVNRYSDSNNPFEIEEGISTPFLLPDITTDTETTTERKEEEKLKRYIKITKLSTETNSSLIRKEVDLLKVTETIESNCRYPFSSIVGVKTDSRSFREIPSRTYRCKLKRVLVPSNYDHLYATTKKDKRYYNTKKEFEETPIQDKLIYNGDWDGSFKTEWTDNPAWILYDMLLSRRYGLGSQISFNQVNKWDLYKIARFCDAVDENGYFIGVDDGRGGIEPRFSCNILFSKGIDVFDAINSISAIFRGIVFFENSTINFSDDRLKTPIALFSNSNVQEGFFDYSSYKRDEKFNSVEISYKDRFDRYKTKFEYIEDEKDIIKRGLFKKEIIGVGITSKAMALRAAKHLMYQTTKENETVSFVAGVESLLCKPGDLIIIEDDLKTLNTNFGKVLSIDTKNKTIRTSEKFKAGDFNQKITLYIPTGETTPEELDIKSQTQRERIYGFSITGQTTDTNFNENFSGNYSFSKYSKGYELGENLIQGESEFLEEYAVYTGDNQSEPIIWFDIYSTGWVFSTGEAFTNDINYNKFITSGNIYNFKTFNDPISEEISDCSGWVYTDITENKRLSPSFSFSGEFSDAENAEFKYVSRGLLDSEIEISSTPKIRTLNITGWGGYEGLQAKEYGDIVYIDQSDINADLLKYVPEGTTYRFESKSYSDQVYKIQSIKEKDNYSYNIIANKYNSGKYKEIEESITTELEEDVFGYDQLDYTINEINYINLEAPSITETATGYFADSEGNDQYYIDLSWSEIEEATGYNIIVIGGESSTNQTIKETTFRHDVSEYNYLYTIKIKSVSDKFNNNEYSKRYNDSDYTIEKIRAGNQDISENSSSEFTDGGNADPNPDPA